MTRILAVAALVAMALPPSAVAESGQGPAAVLTGAVPAPDGRTAAGATIPGLNPAALAALKLTADQRSKVTEIERDLKRKESTLIGSIRELRWKQHDAFKAPEVDVEAVRRNYDEMAALRKQMFDLALDGRKRIESVLTREQRVEASEWTGPSPPAHKVVEPGSDRKPR